MQGLSSRFAGWVSERAGSSSAFALAAGVIVISAEDLSEEELTVLYTHYQRLAEMAKQDSRITQSHSIDEAEARHARKQRKSRNPAPALQP